MKITEFNPEWVRSAQTGDQSAITALYEYSYQNVYLTIKSMLKGDKDTVLDLMQDIFLKAFDNLDQLRDPNNFNAWVKSIARNKTKDWLKKSKPVLFSALSSGEANAPELQFEDDDVYNLPDVVMDRQETSRLINEILDVLSDSQRAAIGMFYYQEMSINEIAAELDVKPGTVKALLSQGRQKVKVKVKELEKEGTKLYSLAPIPFLIWLLRNWTGGEMAEPNAELLERILRGTQNAGKLAGTKAAAGTAAKATAGVGAKADAATVGQAIAVRMISIIAVVVILGGGVACGIRYVNSRGDAGETSALTESSGSGAAAAFTSADDTDEPLLIRPHWPMRPMRKSIPT